MLKRMLAYWTEKRGDRMMPSRDDLDPIDIPDLLPYVILLDVIPPDRRLKVRLAGTMIVDMFGSDYTGQFLDEIDFGEVRAKILNDYSNVVDCRYPCFSDHAFRKLGGTMFDIERVILPLSNDGETVSMLFALLDFVSRRRDRDGNWQLDP